MSRGEGFHGEIPRGKSSHGKIFSGEKSYSQNLFWSRKCPNIGSIYIYIILYLQVSQEALKAYKNIL